MTGDLQLVRAGETDLLVDYLEAASALASPRARAFLGWSRFPFVVVDRTEAPPRVLLNDYRYSDAGARAVRLLGVSVHNLADSATPPPAPTVRTRRGVDLPRLPFDDDPPPGA